MSFTATTTDTVRFEDIERLVPTLFNVWRGEGETRWARFAWTTLERHGLTRIDADTERSAVIVRLLALSALGKAFYARVFDEGYLDDCLGELGESVGHPQGIERSWLREQMRIHDVIDEEDDSDLAEGAIEHLLPVFVRDEASTVASALRRSLSDAELFACLYASAREGTYPLTAEAVSEIVDSGDEAAVFAYGWIEEGMGLE